MPAPPCSVHRAHDDMPAIGRAAFVPPDPLAHWIHAMGRKEEPALAHLHARCLGRVYACAKAIVIRAEIADEVASACFMQAWRDAAHFDSTRGSAIGWLLMIARSRALDALRQRAVRDRHEFFLDDVDLEEIAGDDHADPRAACELRHRDSRLHALMTALLPMQRQLIQLAFTQGLTHQEVALHTRLPLGTVKSHINRGLRALRVQCDATGITLGG